MIIILICMNTILICMVIWCSVGSNHKKKNSSRIWFTKKNSIRIWVGIELIWFEKSIRIWFDTKNRFSIRIYFRVGSIHQTKLNLHSIRFNEKKKKINLIRILFYLYYNHINLYGHHINFYDHHISLYDHLVQNWFDSQKN
jgi:hypothetical protein